MDWDEMHPASPCFGCAVDFVGESGAVIAIAGEFDMACAPKMRDVLDDLRDRGVTDIVVDLSDCTLIDSTGLGLLVVASKMTASPLNVVAPGRETRRALSVTGLDGVFVLHDTLKEAEASLVGTLDASRPAARARRARGRRLV